VRVAVARATAGAGILMAEVARAAVAVQATKAAARTGRVVVVTGSGTDAAVTVTEAGAEWDSVVGREAVVTVTDATVTVTEAGAEWDSVVGREAVVTVTEAAVTVMEAVAGREAVVAGREAVVAGREAVVTGREAVCSAERARLGHMQGSQLVLAHSRLGP